jgi:hypothetical protein
MAGLRWAHLGRSSLGRSALEACCRGRLLASNRPAADARSYASSEEMAWSIVVLCSDL